MLPNSEWILLAILAVILLKPEDIPIIASFLGKLMRQARQAWSDLIPELGISKATNLKIQKMHPFHSAPPKSKVQPFKD
jgi:Sec-independent protein translocase protein TatA